MELQEARDRQDARMNVSSRPVDSLVEKAKRSERCEQLDSLIDKPTRKKKKPAESTSSRESSLSSSDDNNQ